MPYRDLRQYLATLEEHGLLAHVQAEVDKDWEISAVARQTFRAIPQDKRPALMFDRVRGCDIPLVVGILGGSRTIYGLAMECPVEEAQDRWAQATAHPIEPRMVREGPCQEEIYCDEEVDKVKLPVPIWSVGQDPGPYHTSPFVISKDPETGVQNVGTYRVQEKSARRLGIMINPPRNMNHHIRKNDALGKPTEVAIVFGTDPTIGLAAVTPFPYGVDELAVAGGVRGEPVDVVRGHTVDLLVPATAEIVIEGRIPPGGREQEGPFGEYAGYMGTGGNHPFIDVTCITTRHKPIYQAFMSQMPPSESSCIKQIGRESMIFRHLRDNLSLPVKDVHLTEGGGATGLLLISMAKQNHSQPLKAMWGAWSLHDVFGKITIVVDDDIDVRDHFQVEWAMSFRMQPATDVRVYDDTDALTLDPSQADYSVPNESPLRRRSSKVGIDATKKHGYPPLAVPPKEHMDRVAADWAKYGITPVD
ncbi:MAG TPA: UbiD family decarboxylase [Chloroflexota bacterium]|nr:UbiD family decarboxylase [Chloroflexota bacterium]